MLCEVGYRYYVRWGIGVMWDVRWDVRWGICVMWDV